MLSRPPAIPFWVSLLPVSEPATIAIIRLTLDPTFGSGKVTSIWTPSYPAFPKVFPVSSKDIEFAGAPSS